MIFFDLDGPILDVSGKYYRVYADIVGQLGGYPLPRAEYWSRKRAREPDVIILRDSGVAATCLAPFQARRRELIETRPYWLLDVVWPEVRAALVGLADRMAVVLVTLRNNPAELRAELAELGLASCFAGVLSASGDASGPDRHAAKVSLVRARYGTVAPGWFVGDTETDLRSGTALGLRRAAVTFGIRETEALRRENPDQIFNQPRELADWLLSNPDLYPP